MRDRGTDHAPAHDAVTPAKAGVQLSHPLHRLQKLRTFLQLTEQVRDTARRRVLHGESVPNDEKLFSIFEPHTQLYKRGKAGEPIQYGRLVFQVIYGLTGDWHESEDLTQDTFLAAFKAIEAARQNLRGAKGEVSIFDPAQGRSRVVKIEADAQPEVISA